MNHVLRRSLSSWSRRSRDLSRAAGLEEESGRVRTRVPPRTFRWARDVPEKRRRAGGGLTWRRRCHFTNRPFRATLQGGGNESRTPGQRTVHRWIAPGQLDRDLDDKAVRCGPRLPGRDPFVTSVGRQPRRVKPRDPGVLQGTSSTLAGSARTCPSASYIRNSTGLWNWRRSGDYCLQQAA